MIVERVYEHKASQIKQSPVNANRASQLGHPCTRFLVYERTRWQEKTLHKVGLQLVFDIGNDIERRVIRDLEDAGITVIEQQRSYSWPQYQITAHLDFKVLEGGYAYPCECKSMSPFAFEKVNSVEDMLKSKYAYMRAYPGQLNIYLLLDNKEKGFFILKNKVNGQMKEIPVNLDYDLAESLLKKAEIINYHVAAGTLPDKIEDSTCDECGYNHICLPDRNGKEIVLADDPELEDEIDKWFTLKNAVKEYNELDREIKEKVKGQDNILLGNFHITGKMLTRKGFVVKDSEYWQSKIIKVA